LEGKGNKKGVDPANLPPKVVHKRKIFFWTPLDIFGPIGQNLINNKN